MTARDDADVGRVVVEIVPPNAAQGGMPGQVVNAQVDRVRLSREDGNVRAGHYADFNVLGVYTLIAYA